MPGKSLFASISTYSNRVLFRMLLYSNLQTGRTDIWAISNSTKILTKVCIKLLLLLEKAIKLNFEAL